jgi:hypothetical protein
MMLHSAQKCHGKRALRMALPNTLGPDPSGVRLHPLRSSQPPQRGFRTRGWDCTPSSLGRCRRYVWGFDRALGRTGRSQIKKPTGEESVPASGAPWVAFCPLSFGLARGRIEASTRCSRELSTYCTTMAPRMLFSRWYTLIVG